MDYSLNSEKDRECKEAEEKHSSANRHLQTIETTVSNIQTQLRIKEDELRGEDFTCLSNKSLRPYFEY